MTDPRPRLLLVEDEATISVALGRLLDRWGFDTLAARTVNEAQALLASVAVDLVVIDFRLPDVRGDDFLGWLQQEYPELAQRSLFITGDYGEAALGAIGSTKSLSNCVNRPLPPACRAIVAFELKEFGPRISHSSTQPSA